MSSIVKGKNISTKKVTFSSPRVLDSGAKLVYVNYNEGRFNVQTPWMNLPWELKTYEDEKVKKYTLTLSFRGMDENPTMSDFHDKLVELEQRIIEGGVQNSVAWFKKKNLTKDTVEALFNPIVKVSTDKETGEPDGKWPPSMRAKVPYRDSKFQCKVYDKEGTQFRINDPESGDVIEDIFVKGAKVRCILQCVGLWISSGNYMCQWQVTKAEVELPEGMSNHNFLPDSDGEGEGEEETTASGPMLVEDSEEEQEVVEEEEEEVTEPEPKSSPKTVKKTGTRKLKRPKKQ